MITGKDLKRMLSWIPDNAAVTVNGNPNVDIVEVKGETTPFGIDVELKLTAGFSIVKDSFVDGLYNELKGAYEKIDCTGLVRRG